MPLLFLSTLSIYFQVMNCVIYDQVLGTAKLFRDSFIWSVTLVAISAEIEKRVADISYLLISLVLVVCVFFLCRIFRRQIILRRLSNFNVHRANEFAIV